MVVREFKNNLPGSLQEGLNKKEKEVLCKDLNEPLAYICEMHNIPNIAKQLEIDIPEKFSKTSLKIDLLTALLQLCDAMHMDKSRLINEEKFVNDLNNQLDNNLNETSFENRDWIRYFQCYFIEHSKVKKISKNIFKLQYDVKFNIEEDEKIRDRFLDVYVNRLLNNRHDCLAVINRQADIHFLNDSPFNVKDGDSIKLKVPAKLFSMFDKKEKKAVKHITTPEQADKRKISPFFVGRGDDIKAVIDKIRDEPKRMVTICGPPGAGKTELSLHIGKEVEANYKDGINFVSFEGYDNYESFLLKLNTCLGISDDSSPGPFMDYVAGKEALIILDNLEDPLNDRKLMVNFLGALHQACNKSSLIITSRESIGNSQIESVIDIEPLSRNDAKILLLQLGGCKEPSDPKEIDKLEQLLDALSGLPIAIVLTAPYLKLGFEVLLNAINQSGLEMLKTPGLDPNEAGREQSIIKSFSLSYKTIKDTVAGDLFCLFSLFPAGLTGKEAKELLHEASFLDFAALTHKSLINSQPNGRFTMLPPIRYYASQLFDQLKDISVIQQNWMELINKLSNEYDAIYSGNSNKNLDELIDELPNIFYPLNLILNKKIDPVVADDHGFSIVFNIAHFLISRRFRREGFNLFTGFKKNAAKTGDMSKEANCIQRLGDIFLRESKNRDAEDSFKMALPLYQKIGSILGEANCIQGFGKTAFKQGEVESGREKFYETINW